MEIKDSGHRTQFSSGAVRDARPGVGRCDLLPLDIIAEHRSDHVLMHINTYVRIGNPDYLWKALRAFRSDNTGATFWETILDVSKQFEDGAEKYGERNWERGIPLHCYIDSAVRHYIKLRCMESDEPHDRAVCWNLLCAIWTHKNKPEMIDLPFAEVKHEDN